MVGQTPVTDMSLEQIKEDTKPLMKYSFILGVLLYGSYVQGTLNPRSDIDIAVVAPNIPDRTAFLHEAFKMLASPPYDIKIFELFPLYLKIDILGNHYLLHTPSRLDLYDYLRYYYKLWNDQAHRQHLDRKNLFKMLNT
ncbi:MAG: nucleotidyltransferase domain-containing protein [Candidatus Ranarchaeia archaeon]